MSSLSARGVKTMLTRAGVDHSSVTITDANHHQVVITGSRDLLRPVREVLYDKGLSCAPYPEHDIWTRR